MEPSIDSISLADCATGAWICNALLARLKPPCRVCNSDTIVETVASKGENGLRADACVSCSPEDSGRGRFMKHPHIIVEVRSPSNYGTEFEEKLFEYRDTPSIRQPAIVESEKRFVRSYARDAAGRRRLEEATVAGVVRFPTAGVEMTFAEIYRRTSLAVEAEGPASP